MVHKNTNNQGGEFSSKELLEEIHELSKTVSALNRALIRLQMKLYDKETVNTGEVKIDTNTIH